MSMINWNGRNAIISSYWVCLFTKFRWRLHRALRLAWITWIPFILWFSMIFKIGLNIVHGFMNATFIDDSLYQWSLTINVHSCIYEHTSCMINDHRNSYEHWSSMIIDIDYDSWRSMIVAMKCCWSYMISVDHCIISWTLQHVWQHVYVAAWKRDSMCDSIYDSMYMWQQENVTACVTECDVPVPGIPGTGNFHFFWWYRNRYRKNLVPEKSTGIGIGKIWYRKKYRNWYRKKINIKKALFFFLILLSWYSFIEFSF